MNNIVSFADFKNKRRKDPDFKAELNKKKVKDLQESLRRINTLMSEIKADARRQIDALSSRGEKDA